MITRIIRLMNNRKGQYLLAITCLCMLEVFSSTLFPLCIRGITNGALKLDSHKLTMSILGYVGVYLAWWVISPLCQILIDRTRYQTMKNFKCSMCEHLVKLPISYFDNTRIGEIISKVTGDMSCLESMIQGNLQNVARKSMGGMAGLIIMFILDYRFALIVLVLGSISIYTTKYFTKRMEEKSRSLLEQRANTSCDFMEMIKSCKNIRLLHIQSQKQKAITTAAGKEKEFRMENGNINAKMNSIIFAIDIIVYLTLLFIGCVFVYYSWADWGSIIALINLKVNTDMLFSEFPSEYSQYKNNLVGVKRLFALYDLKEEENVTREYLTEEENELALKLKNITFSYDGVTNVLTDFSMKAVKNKITLIEGESGKGKSTIIKLILGLYQVLDGHILFNQDCSTVAYVPQEAQLYRDTIYENISCGSENATKEDVYIAAKQAGVDEFVKDLEEGYDTILSDDGNKLSGGQKQRISLARALVMKSNILLLDEVTSALDKENRDRLLETIVHLKQYCSIIFITHDKSIESISDEVIML